MPEQPTSATFGSTNAPTKIILPFPPSSLSGHAKGHWRSKSTPTATHRHWAKLATQAAKLRAPAAGDIAVHVRFVPPDRRGDRTNFPNRLKPYFDGIADALGVNDARFLPSYEFGEPEKPGRVEILIGRAA
jgi:hypothetical protein